MFFNFDYIHFDGNTLTYGNYGGLNYSAGTEGGTALVPADPAPVDDYDAAFYDHDLVYQTSTDPAVLREADVQLIEEVYALASDAISDWLW